jgi:C4-dicarboxylate-specific signal transduction histidine kinase
LKKIANELLFPVFIWTLIGVFIPFIFVALDINELELPFNSESILWVVKSQRVLIFAAFGLPSIFACIGFLFVRLRHQKRNIEKANQEIILQKQRSENSARLASVGELAAGVGHEINNPLAIIKGFLMQIRKAIVNGDFSKDKALERIDKCIGSVHRISRIVRGLKSLSRDGSMDPFEKVQLETIISDVHSLVMSRLHLKTISFQIIGLEEEHIVECKQVLLGQVLTNLITNSIDALEEIDNKWVKLEIIDKSGFIHISVTDSGSGITEDVSAKIFEPFFTTKSVGEGTGLGMSISKTIIDHHGGEFFIDCDSPNTKFVIILPKFQNTTQKVA